MEKQQILSEMPVTGSAEKYEQDRLGFLTRYMREEYQIVRYNTNTYIINQVDLIEQILTRTNHQFQIPSIPFRRNQHEDRITDWMEKRRSLSQGLHQKAVSAYAKNIVSITEQILDGWHTGQTLHPHEHMKRLTAYITSFYFFGQSVQPFIDLSYKFTNAFFKVLSNPFILPKWLPQLDTSRMNYLLIRLDKSICQLIHQRRASLSQTPDLLSVLMLTTNEQSRSLSDSAICEILVSLMITSYRSTAAALAWIWFLLSGNPDVEETLHQEIIAVIGNQNRPFNYDDLYLLRYLENIIKEALRLYPPSWLIIRDVAENCEINGFIFEKGQKLMMSTYAVQRNPRFFRDPDSFLPDRWSDEITIKSLPKYSYFPFGGGSRICLGTSLALAELMLITATISRQFRFQLINGTKVKANPQVVLTPENFKVVIERRKL